MGEILPRIYCGGTFDLFHAGHVNFLRACSELGEVVVALNTDEFAARYKRLPVYDLEERIHLLEACRYVSYVTVNDGDEDSRPAIRRMKPQFIAHGDDWTGEALMRQMNLTQDFLDVHGIRMLYVPYTRSVSTTDIIRRCIESSGTAT